MDNEVFCGEKTPDVLLSYRRPVWALTGGAGAVTDGICDARVHWDGGAAPASCIIDLGGLHRVRRVRVITYYGDGRYYHFRVSTSRGSGAAYALFGEKTDDTPASEEGTTLEGEGVLARYVKVEMLYNSANEAVHIAECEVWGDARVEDELAPSPLGDAPAEETSGEEDAFSPKNSSASLPTYGEKDASAPLDLALHKPCRANSGGAFASFVTDGDPESCWVGEAVPKHVDIDLLANYSLTKVIVRVPSLSDFRYILYASRDGVRFERLAKSEEGAPVPAVGENTARAFSFPGTPPARVLRVMITGSSRGAGQVAMISGVSVFGEAASGPLLPTRRTLSLPTYKDWLREAHGIDIPPRARREDSFSAQDTIAALRGLVTRVMGEGYADRFDFRLCPAEKDRYRVFSSGGKIAVEGRNGVCAAVGVRRYLEDCCGAQISQQTKQMALPPPAALPLPEGPLAGECAVSLRYAYNYCTHSYTMPFFGREDWQRELDYLLLEGVNLVLDLTGSEALWVAYLQKLGYTADEAKDFVCGYCYKAWWLMGNLEGYGGPVGDTWIFDTLQIARENQRYLTVMGAQPALQTFVGALPESFAAIAGEHLRARGFPDVTPYLAPQGLWAGGFVRPNVLKTTYPGYSYLAELFYQTQEEIYGNVTNFYCGDVCHEGGIVPADLSKAEMSAKILDELLKANERGVWILQGWWSNPMREVLEGFGSRKREHVLILDLAALANPKWTDEKTWGSREFGGTGWIFCNLDNYGGRTGMHGKLREMTRLVRGAMSEGKLLAGVGITPEGTFGNPAVFDLYWRLPWTSPEEEFDFDAWLARYVDRRYGEISPEAEHELQAAWEIFSRTVYGVDSYDGTTKNNVICENASFSPGYCAGPYYKIAYDRDEFEKGVAHFAAAGRLAPALLSRENYVYDAVDLFRMLPTIAADDLFDLCKAALSAGDAKVFGEAGAAFLSCMEAVRHLCAYQKDALLGTWVGRARDFRETSGGREPPGGNNYDDFDEDLMEISARALLTVWASSPITNYAARQLDRLMEDYYERMWRELIEKINAAFSEGRTPPVSLGAARCYEIGWDFALKKETLSRTPLPAEGGGVGRTPSLLDIYEREVAPHAHTRAKISALTQSLLEKATTTAPTSEDLTATVATNIEH